VASERQILEPESGLVRAARLATASLLGAVLLAAAPIPFGHAGAAWLALLLAFPPMLVAVLLGELVRRFLHRHPWRALARLLSQPGVQAQIVAGGGTMLIGGYASNMFLIDLPLGQLTMFAYVGTAMLALGVAMMIRWMVGRPLLRARLFDVPNWAATTVTILLFGCSGVFTDAVILPGGTPRLHRICLLLVIPAFAAVASLCARRLPLGRVGAAAGAASLLIGLGALTSAGSATRLAADAPPTLHTLLLSEARDLLDRDGDGYSALLGGGDCDDGDPTTYPLSLAGRDCLGWIPPGAQALPARAPLQAPAVSAGPSIIVMVTVDAFRCGFGQPATGAFRDLCPQLTRLALDGRARLDAHSGSPNTDTAMRAIHLGGVRGPGPALGTLLAGAGYRSHAIVTHQVLLRAQAIPDSFGSVDGTLVPLARDPTATTAAATTDRALEWLRVEERKPGKLFLWAHYLDPHDPYVATPGSMLVLDHRRSYSAEVRRTDAQVGRLAEGLGQLARARDVLLLVLADHGEAFGEHGRDHHFTSIHEESTRIPVVAWSPGPEPARFVTAPLPATALDLRAFLMAVVGGAPYRPAPEALIETGYPEDPQVGILAAGWKLIHHRRFNYDELYDLGADPFERDDRASRDPQKVAELGQRLGRLLLDPSAR